MPWVILALLATEPLFATQTREMMTTRVTVAISGAEPAAARRGFDAAFAAFGRVNEVMNEWEPDSVLGRINRGAGGRKGVAAPRDLCEVLQIAIDGARKTDRLFDPTWAALRDVWKFDASHSGQVPHPDVLVPRCKLIDARSIQITSNKSGCTVRLPKKGMALGLGGIAKGWGVDRAVAKLRSLGLRDFFVQAGGDFYAAGMRGDRPWRVGIRDPRGGPEDTLGVVEVRDAAFSTSGDYEHWFEAFGVRYHHIIDPRTCQPARASQQSTVLAKTATDAEVLTKATFILGGEAGLALAHRNSAAAVLVDADGHVRASPELEGRIAWTTR
ncbi:MAG: FAD:protein FMN transferase [Myxococcales bacterium]